MSNWQCRKCGLTLNVDQFPVHCSCGHTDHNIAAPGIASKVVGFVNSAAKHISRGLPKCSSIEVGSRLLVCKGCKYYSKPKGMCDICGCQVNDKASFMNKLSWADQECPKGKWIKVSRILRSKKILYGLPSVKHCLYHVYPATASDQWKYNIETLVKYADVFDGRRIAAIACDDKSASFASASELLRRHGFECIEFRNDSQLRETVSFQQLLLLVADAGPHDAIWYGHTKGNIGHDGPLDVVTMWRNIMYRELLGNADRCLVELQYYAAIGTHMLQWESQQQSPFPSGIHNKFAWMFAGTFFWFRADALLGGNSWRDIQQDRYGVEAWLGDRLRRTDVLSVYQPIALLPNGSFNPYKLSSYPKSDHYLIQSGVV